MKFRNPFSPSHAAPGITATVNSSDYSAVHVSSDELVRCRLQAREIRLDSRQPARSAITGGHTSRFRGRGMDYLESRAYQPGDDIRCMDWRVTARTGRAHVKLYQEERERPVVVMIDLGPGMFFATQGAFKSVIAARAAALIGWAAIQHGDRIGALLFNGGHRELRPLGGQRGVMRLIRELAAATDPAEMLAAVQENAAATVDGESSHLNEALMRLRRVARPGSLVFILSDFYAINEDTRRHLQRLRQHNDIVACQIVDPLELEPPVAGRYTISDGRQTGLLDTTSSASRNAYSAYFSAHHRAVKQLMQQSAVHLLRLGTSEDIAQALRFGLANRTTDISNSSGAVA
jgi:uncharacterized protein (DUF58 family)